ncbi:MAG: NERD domain-containing protein [Clostridia bacterium]|nr:NERD domain-containing protein [Clostridia bacterium]
MDKNEELVYEMLKSLPEEYLIINDILIMEKGNGYQHQIDHVVVSIYGIFVIETKGQYGSIYGKENFKSWKCYYQNNESIIENPIKQNYGHVQALINILGINQKAFFPIVCFINARNLRCDIDTYSSYVLKKDELIEYILGKDEEIISPEQIDNIYNTILNNSNPSTSNTQNHIDGITYKNNTEIDCIKNGKCPNCGRNLIIRINPKTHQEFWGCEGYNDKSCFYTHELLEDDF